MPYTTPVTNHSAASHFNVADWTRIYRNSQLASSLAGIMLGTPIQFDAIVLPTTTTNPTTALAMLNTILANIERMRLAMVALIPTLTEVKDDWTAGAGTISPSYTHANQWETTIDAVWDYYSGDSLTGPLTLSADLTVATGTTLIVVDSINTAGYDIILQGTAKLYII